MSGGITQLIAVGQQDAHIIGKPEISFWRSSYKRHTNFAMGLQRQVIQGNPAPGSVSSVRLERKGDLVSYMYLTKSNGRPITMDEAGSEIEYVELYIGGQLIDRHYMDFLVKARSLLANTSAKVNPQGLRFTGTNKEETSFFPFRFFFCEHWASALPLISLQYHDVEIRIQWGSQADATTQYECWANFIHLDNEERKILASQEMDLMITQTQRQSAPGGKVANLTFNHPVKYMVTTVSNPLAEVRIQMNGNDLDEMKSVTPHFNNAPEFYHASYEPRQLFQDVSSDTFTTADGTETVFTGRAVDETTVEIDADVRARYEATDAALVGSVGADDTNTLTLQSPAFDGNVTPTDQFTVGQPGVVTMKTPFNVTTVTRTLVATFTTSEDMTGRTLSGAVADFTISGNSEGAQTITLTYSGTSNLRAAGDLLPGSVTLTDGSVDVVLNLDTIVTDEASLTTSAVISANYGGAPLFHSPAGFTLSVGTFDIDPIVTDKNIFFLRSADGTRTSTKLTVSAISVVGSRSTVTLSGGNLQTLVDDLDASVVFDNGLLYTEDSADIRISYRQMAKFNFFHPFCLDINRFQPTGSVNFSRIDSARLVSNEDIWTSPIYAQNYNILKIKNGLGGLMYAN